MLNRIIRIYKVSIFQFAGHQSSLCWCWRRWAVTRPGSGTTGGSSSRWLAGEGWRQSQYSVVWLNRLCPPDTLTVVHLRRGLWTCIGLSIRYWLMVHLCQILSHVLAYTNSCLNPLLYAKMSRNFRLGFAQVDELFWYVKICCNNWFRRHISNYNLLGR